MSVEEAVIKGLQADRKYLPLWFRYDKLGSVYNDMCLEKDEYYYFHKSEVSVIAQNVEELVGEMELPCVLVDMGSGNADKTRMFIDVLLQKQTQLTYIPVDVSEQHLKDTCESLTNSYGNRLNIQPVAGLYEIGIDFIRTVPGNKLILWFGSIHNLPLDTQPIMLSLLSDVMKANDKLVLTLDATQDKEKIEKAYGGLTEACVGLFRNGLGRLNRDYGANIPEECFRLQTDFIQNRSDMYPSYATASVISTVDQTLDIPGLGITVCFKAGESLMLHDGEGISCKYNIEQIKALVKKAKQRLHQIFIAEDGHAALCCVMNI